MWHNKYVGIPYKDNGRDLSGVDCWGLARYVYNKEFNISLPSFSFNYDGGDRERIEELIAQYREGWEEITGEYKSGDLVLFRMMGYESHVGIITEYPYFLHARENADSSIERLDNSQWKNRVIGVFRYSEAARNNLVAIPHPLKTERITDYIPEGATLYQVHEVLCAQHNISDATGIKKAIIIVNGNLIPETDWNYVVQKNDNIEYRAVAGKEVIRIVAVIALVYFTMGAGGQFAFTLAGFTGATGGTLAILQMGVMAAGMALINAIAPIRPPELGKDPGQSIGQNLINAGSNSAMLYSPIPVVLGRVRMTPPLGAVNYVEPMATEAWLRILLVWDYGPLVIEDIRVGTNLLSEYVQNSRTYYGYGTEGAEELVQFNSVYGKDVQQVVKNIKLVGSEGDAITGNNPSPWQEVSFTQDSEELSYSIHFPQGLRKINTSSGDTSPAPVILEIQYGLASGTDYGTSLLSFQSTTFTIPNSTVITYSNWHERAGRYTSTSESSNYYQWHTIYMNKGGRVSIVSGTPSETRLQEPTSTLKRQIAGELNGYDEFYTFDETSLSGMTRVPALDLEDIPLYDICIYNGTVESTSKRTDKGTHDSIISSTGLAVTISSGTVNAVNSNYIYLGNTNQKWCNQKDAFTYIPDNPIKVTKGKYKLRIRRINSGAADVTGSGYQTLHDAYFYTATAYANDNPVMDPLVGKYARTAIRIKATDQLNGSVDAINGLVTTVCLDYVFNGVTGSWISQTTNNPASLMRYVLQHPANAQRISNSEVSTKIDLPQLQYWHAYCITKGFTYNSVLSNAKSILDVLRDICAAGRASPAIVDGKWTVIIDEPKTTVIQHFSTHNSWGFQGSKPLVKIPDAFKVVYINENANYVQDEFYVYNVGQTETTANVFEELQLPGVTNSEAAFKHARWHLAQLLLRPETYTLNVDMEYLVCNRGDLVRVQHDVPMWGVGTARINTYVNSTTLILDNDIPLEAGTNYYMRIRTATGTSIGPVALASITTSGFYNQIILTAALSEINGAPDNLVMLGIQNKESQECIVLSVEPSTNGSARLTLCDYNSAIYTIDSAVTTEQAVNYPIPNFDPNITKYPDTFISKISQYPTITSVTSDFKAATVTSTGIYTPKIRLSFTETPGQLSLDTSVTAVELQWKTSSDTNSSWPNKSMTLIGSDSCYADNIVGGQLYDLRVRYVSFSGLYGPWTEFLNHTAVGKSINTYAVTNIELSLDGVSLVATASSTNTKPNDFKTFEYRFIKGNTGTTDFWDLDIVSNNIKVVQSRTSARLNITDFPTPRLSEAGITYRVACRAVDNDNNYSGTSVLASVMLKTL
jgi:hypothetical protein